jgi:trimeric autotransporter adhesin
VRAHYRAPVTDTMGDYLAGTAVTILVNGTSTPVGLPLYVDGTSTDLLANPFITQDGTIDFYMDAPQRVDIQIAPPGETSVIIPDIDVQVSSLTTVSLVFTGTGTQSTAVGNDSTATGNQAVAYGDSSEASGQASFAAGQAASASGTSSTAVGQLATVTGNSSTALGQRATAAGQQATALGTAANAAANNSVALGGSATAGGTGAVAVGQGASASGTNSVAIGPGASASGNNQIVLGTSGQTVVIPGSLSAPGAIAFYGIFGNGSGGAVTLDGTTSYSGLTLSGSKYTMTEVFLENPPSSLTVNSGVTLATAGLPLQVDGPVVDNGTIENNGSPASGSSPGPLAGDLIYAAFTGASGTTNQGVAAGAASSVAAGAGGNGGASPAKGAGGTGGTVVAASGTVAWRNPYTVLAGMAVWQGMMVPLGGAAGGGSGSGDGANPGGAGGAGGGAVVILCRSLTNNGLISANGGPGATPIAGNCGGGGGGGGGTVIVVTLTPVSGGGTVTVSPGTGGGATGTGSAGSAGSAGQVIYQLTA